MSTVEKGNKLEDNLYAYLLDQKEKGLLVYDSAPPQLCKIYKKKKYSGSKREIEFDVVIEMFRSGASSPWQYIVFECKNHARPVQDRDVRDFSSKIHEVFKHRGKGVVVTTSRLQSGQPASLKNGGLGS